MALKGDAGSSGAAGSDGKSINWRGEYSGAGVYAVNDAVSYLNSSYICISAINGVLPTDVSRWNVLAAKGTDGSAGAAGSAGTSFVWKGDYSPSTNYVVNDVVAHSGSTYVAILAGSAHVPTNATYWSLMVSKGTDGTNGGNGTSFTWRGEYSAGTTYQVNDTVAYSGSSYVAIQAGINHLPTNSLYWTVIASKGADGGGGSTLYASALANAIISTPVGGAPALAASVWKTKNISEVFDYILFPDLLPTYTVPTLSLSGSYSGFLERGASISQSLSLVGTKNDAGAFTTLTINHILDSFGVLYTCRFSKECL
jgi:hypothetical protein